MFADRDSNQNTVLRLTSDEMDVLHDILTINNDGILSLRPEAQFLADQLLGVEAF